MASSSTPSIDEATLRDMFACAAMEALLPLFRAKDYPLHIAADEAYEIAHHMMLARERCQTPR